MSPQVYVHVQNDRYNVGYLEVIPVHDNLYHHGLRDYLGSVSFSPDSDWSIFPGKELERLVYEGIPFKCFVNLGDIADPFEVTLR